MPGSTSKKSEEEEAVAVPVTTATVEPEKDKVKAEELSEEDQALKEGLELAVIRLQDEDDSLHKPALDHLVNEIRSATSSMTSVPKPLKFLRPHYDTLKKIYESWPANHLMKRLMADVLSVLAMTMAVAGSRESLRYKLAGTQVNISSWGHEYVRSLAGEISEEYNQRALDATTEDEVYDDDLQVLVDDILPFQMKHNAEAEAVDLLMEVRSLPKLLLGNVVDDRNYERVCLYLLRSASYLIDPEDVDILYETTYQIYRNQRHYADACRVALKMKKDHHLHELFADCAELPLVKKQMALIIGADRYPLTLDSDISDSDELNALLGNQHLSEHFITVAKEMDLSTPRTVEDIYKTHLSSANRAASLLSSGGNGSGLDSAKANQASSFVNAWINAAHGQDSLLLPTDSTWVSGKNKHLGQLCAAASVGLLMLWNVEEGLNAIDKYFHAQEEVIRAGACLGVGVCCSGVRNESDPALALLTDYLEDRQSTSLVKTASVMGLAIAYAGSQREEIDALLEGLLCQSSVSVDGNPGPAFLESAFSALALGLVHVGSANEEVSSLILQRLMEASPAELSHAHGRWLALGLGLLFLGRGEAAEAVLEAVKTVEHEEMVKFTEIVVTSCAFAGSGNVLKVQSMLRHCADHLTEQADFQSVAVIGIALIALGEDVGSEMSIRTLEHLLQYSQPPIRKMVPLAIALLYVSNPDYAIIDILSRLTHDSDHAVAINSILALGLVAAGSNNSRIGNLLRQLADFYGKDAQALYVVRLAQGLNALGKGLLTLSPLHSDRFVSKVSSPDG